MANIGSEQAVAGVWQRRIAFFLFGIISIPLVATLLFGGVMAFSGVLEW